MNESLIPAKHGSAQNNVAVLTLPTPGPQGEIALPEIWRVFRRRKLLIAGCVVGMTILAGILSAFLPRRYEALARIVVNPQNSNVLGLDPLDALSGGALNNDIIQQTQAHILESAPVAWDVIKQLRLDQRSDFAGKWTTAPGESIERVPAFRKVLLLEKFSKALRIEAVPKTELIEVRFRAADPQLTANVVNALTKAYIERTFRTRYDATLEASNWLSKQIDDLKKNVEASQERFTEYQKKSGIIGTDESHNTFVVQLDEMSQQMAAAEAERILREARYSIAQSANPEMIADVAQTSTLAILRAQQADLKNQYVQLTAKYGKAYPRVAQLDTQLKRIEAGIATQVEEIRTQFKEEYDAASKNEHMLDVELEKQKQEAYRMNDAGIQFAILKQDFESSRDLYEDLMKKLTEAGIVAGLHSTNVDVIDPAEIPATPADPRVVLNLALAIMLGAFGGVGTAFLLERMDTTISMPDNGETLANLPVLGVIPHLGLNGSSGHQPLLPEEEHMPFLLSRPNSQFAEAIRALRTTVLLSHPGAPPKVIMISSAAPGEGKTTVSVNCAIALAQKGARVLLVDADLRRSGAQGQLRMQGEGLSSCLAGSLDPRELVKPLAGVANLDVLPSGRRPPNPVELLDSERMRALLEKWREQYTHVVIDTPPVGSLSDAMVLSPCADAVVLVARSKHTSRQSLCRARDILAQVNARTVGVIINDLDLRSVDYYSYYGYNDSKYGEYYGQDATN